MRKCVLVFLVLLSISSLSQKRDRLDSLLRTEKTLKQDTSGVKSLLKIASLFKKINFDSSMLYYNKATELATKINNTHFYFQSRFEKCVAIKSKSDIKALIDTLLAVYAHPLLENDLREKVSFCQELGVAYRRISIFDKSIKYLLEALELAKKGNYKTGLYNAYNSLANTYSQAGVIKKSYLDLERALPYYDKAFLYVDTNNKGVVAMILNNRGVTSYNIGQIKRDSNATKNAIPYYEKSLALREEIKDSASIASSYNNIGSAYHDLCEFYKKYNYLDKALWYYEKAVGIDRLTHSGDAYANLINYGTHLALIGKVKSDKVSIKKATRILTSALGLSEKANDYYSSSLIYENLGTCYGELNQKDSVIFCLYKYIALKDSLINEGNQQIAEEMAAKYESDLKDAENNNLKLQAGLKEEIIHKKSNTINLMIGASVVMLFLVVLVLISRQKIKNSRLLIEQQKKETEKQKQLIEEKQKEILDSINYSKRLQDAAIPSSDYFKSLLPQSFIFYKPKDIVAGDFYWIHKVGHSNSVLVAAADCTGHGVPGALVSIVCLNAINRCVEELNITQPAKILDKAAEIIQQSFRQSENDVKDGMDIALCLLDLDNMKGYFSGANNPVWILTGEHVTEIKADNQPVGQQHIPKPFTQHEFNLEKGCTILLATDGYSDQFGGEHGKKLKTRKFKEIFPKLNSMPINDVHSKIEDFFVEWKGEYDQVDDVLVIGIRV